MKKILKFIPLMMFIILGTTFAQQRPMGSGGQNFQRGPVLMGVVKEYKTGELMQYANVILFSSLDSSQTQGTITDEKGRFFIPGVKSGRYYATVSFIGFDAQTIDDIKIDESSRRVDLGEVILEPHSYETDDIVVQGERSPISYEIDKKVINVDQNITATAGNAAEVLENVPSITVDIEGNVSLRGSGNFTVLIDGRPTIMDANDVLQQTAASSIENIEIITNPSAKYDPEGTAGIINLVMKKNQRQGLSALLDIKGGLREKYGADASVELKTENYDLNFGVDYNNQLYFMDQTNENRTTFGGNTSYLNSDASGHWGRIGYGLKGEFAYHLSDKSIWSVGGRYSDGGFENEMEQNFLSWENDINNSNSYYSITERSRKGDRYSIYTNFEQKFDTDDHKLTLDISYQKRNGDEETLNKLVNFNDPLANSFGYVSGQKNLEYGPSEGLNTKLDYALPINSTQKFEAGFQTDLDESTDFSNLLEYDLPSNQFVIQPQFSNSTNYKRNVYALYSIYKGEIGSLGYQAGVRGEYTDRSVSLLSTGDEFVIDRFDYFPSAYLSYKFDNDMQLMTSYTKRINRPRGWYLEPFETFTDAYNVRVGNPGLKPEYIDSYELGWQTLFGNTMLSIEAYYREVENKIERIVSPYAPNVTLQSIENVGKDYAFGNEIMFNFDPVEKWNVNLMGNLYNYKVEGELDGRSFARESFNWSLRFNNTFKFSTGTMLQFNGMYNSKSVSAQGTREGFFMASIAVKQEFFERALSATLQVRDLFGTAEYRSVSESLNYYNSSFTQRESPVVMLNLRWNFNMRRDSQSRRGDDGFDMEGGGDF